MIIMLVVFCSLLSFLVMILAPTRDAVMLVSRDEWDTMGPSRLKDLKQISLPVKNLIVSHTNDGGRCTERVGRSSFDCPK